MSNSYFGCCICHTKSSLYIVNIIYECCILQITPNILPATITRFLFNNKNSMTTIVTSSSLQTSIASYQRYPHGLLMVFTFLNDPNGAMVPLIKMVLRVNEDACTHNISSKMHAPIRNDLAMRGIDLCVQ